MLKFLPATCFEHVQKGLLVTRRRIHSGCSMRKNINISGHKVNIDGINIHYERVGNGEHKVLLLPGSLGTSRTDFTPQLENMDREKFTLIAWDPPGYGLSRPPDRDFSGDYYRRDANSAAKLMQCIGIDKYSLMGWSAGGTTALIIAANYGQNINKVVVWCTNAYLSNYEKQISQLGRDPDSIPHKLKEVYYNVYGKESFDKMWTELCDAYGSYDDICQNDLPNINANCLIMHAKQDKIVSPKHALLLNREIKNSQIYWFPGSYHNIHQKFTKEFNKVVQNFLLEGKLM